MSKYGNNIQIWINVLNCIFYITDVNFREFTAPTLCCIFAFHVHNVNKFVNIIVKYKNKLFSVS